MGYATDSTDRDALVSRLAACAVHTRASVSPVVARFLRHSGFAGGGCMKVLLLEINEITWRLIDPLERDDALPMFRRLKTHGAWGTTESADEPPYLDPWTTWTTVYTGTPVTVHRSTFLQQPPGTIRAPRLWEIAHDAGRSVGIYGSLNAWPPPPVRGFVVPDTFAPAPDTYPPELADMQAVNLKYTRGYNYGALRHGDGLTGAIRTGVRLMRLGVGPATMARVVGQLAHERVRRRATWRRVSLHPQVNFDVFARAYRRARPDFATFHTNHVAHYQHLYWRAMDPALFPHPPFPDEVMTYRGAIAHGYRVADRLVARALDLIDGNTILVVASSMGQQPYINPHLAQGKRLMRVRSFDDLLAFLDLDERVRVVQTMSDQFNLHADPPALLERVRAVLRSAVVDGENRMFHVSEAVDGAVTVNLRPVAVNDASRCRFVVNGEPRETSYSRLVEVFDHAKSGCHHPEGMVAFVGRGIRPGRIEGPISTLDLAPTILSLMDIDVPPRMKGRVLFGSALAAAG